MLDRERLHKSRSALFYHRGNKGIFLTKQKSQSLMRKLSLLKLLSILSNHSFMQIHRFNDHFSVIMVEPLHLLRVVISKSPKEFIASYLS